MCGSMVDIQSTTAEIRRGKKEEERKKNKLQDENIMNKYGGCILEHPGINCL